MHKRTRLSLWVAGVAILVSGCGGAEAPSLQAASPVGSFEAKAFAMDTPHWTQVASMNAARTNHSAVLLDSGEVLVAGGSNTYGPLQSAELYNPYTDTWTPTGSMNAPHEIFTAVRLGSGRVLVTGGYWGFEEVTSNLAELYDPATGTWSLTGSMVVPRMYQSSTLLDSGQVLVAGGITPSGSPLEGAELYDPATGTWRLTGPMSSYRALAHSATRLYSGEVMLTGGVPFTFEVDMYNPATNTWRRVQSLPTARANHSATRLYSGYVLVAGGMDESRNTLSSVDVYDPYNDRWFSAPPMNRPRRGHTATLLYSGQVLVTGGMNSSPSGNTYESTSEVYDPAANTWTVVLDDMRVPRFSHTATLLPSGEVLVAGGTSRLGYYRYAERYTP